VTCTFGIHSNNYELLEVQSATRTDVLSVQPVPVLVPCIKTVEI